MEQLEEAVTNEVMLAAPPQYWPEPLRDNPQVDPFPLFVFLSWLLPGVVMVVLLLTPYILLRAQATRKIAFFTSQGQLVTIRADGAAAPVAGSAPLTLEPTVQSRLKETLPVLGLPEWAPDGRSLAATVEASGSLRVALFAPETGAATLIAPARGDTTLAVMPAAGWSPSGDFLVLLEHDGTRPFLSFVDVARPEPAAVLLNVTPDTRAAFAWHPDGHRLLITTVPDGTSASTLQLVDHEGTVQPFIPNDNRLIRADGTWSPNGEQIAYIATNTYIGDSGAFLPGSLWVADSDGQNARQLVADEVNFAPIWDMTNPSRIYFTRYLSSTNSFELARITLFGAQAVERIGPSPEAFVQHPFDRRRFLQWPTDAAGTLAITDEPTPAASRRGFTPLDAIQARLQQTAPLMGIPQWSPDGRQVAVTMWENGQIQATLFAANGAKTPIPSNVGFVAVPSDGWSSSGTHLALVEHDGRPLLTILDTTQLAATVFNFTLDTRAGLSWHPTADTLLVTAHTAENAIPALRLVDSNGADTEFAPADGQIMRADGAWSPDGSQIAYVAAATYTDTLDILAGQLWLADSNGANPRLLVSDDQVVAPIWSPTGDFLFFTRYHREVGRFAMYRLATDGLTPEEYIGPASELLVQFPLDRNLWLQWSPDGRQTLFAGEEPLQPVRYRATLPDAATVAQIQDRLPLLGVAQWSPDGSQLAGTVVDEGIIRVALFKSSTGPPVLSPESPDLMGMPADGWSPDSTYLALLRHNGEQAHLAVLNTAQASMATTGFPLDTRAGLSWHPTGSQIMVTSSVEGITPTLQIYNAAQDATRTFAPPDGQTWRADGVWAPDGRQVVYIAGATVTDTMGVLAGPLWLAEASGQSPRQLVSDGYNLAPLWDTANGRILFTRYLTETAAYDLYQVNLEDGHVERIGPSHPAMAEFPFDRQLWRKWSPDGRRWLLPGATSTPYFLYRAAYDGTSVDVLPAPCETTNPFTARWAPTNRALLIACPSGEMFLRWLDRVRPDTVLPDGLFPSWQP